MITKIIETISILNSDLLKEYLVTEVSRKRRERRGRGFHCCLGGSGIRRSETAGRPIVTNSWFSFAVASMRGGGESGRDARVRGGM